MKIQSILFENKEYIPLLVSYILCIHKKDESINNCLNSIRDQNYRDIELIIVIDSDDYDLYLFIKNKCKNLLQINTIVLFNNKNCGLAYSLNRGIKISKGEFIARIDSDDCCLKNRTEIQVKFLNENKNIFVLGGNAIVDANNKKIIKSSRGHDRIKRILKYKNPIIHPTVMIRRVLFNHFKYDENYKYCQDYKLWVDIIETFSIENVDIPLIYYNIHENQNSFKRLKYVLRIYSHIFIKYKSPLTILGLSLHILTILKKKLND